MSTTVIIAIVIFVVLVLAGIALAMRASAKKKAAAAAITQAKTLGISALDQYSRVISSESLDQRVASL